MTANVTPPGEFLLLHGWQNRRPEGHWQHWLADQLTGLGLAVTYPQLPDPDYPELEAWLDELRGAAGVVICHSLACLLWMHAVARHGARIRVDRVLLVAPPSPSVAASHAEIAGFLPPPLTPGQLADVAVGGTWLVASDNDPYCPEGGADVYGRPLDLVTEVIPGGGHLDPDSGYGQWSSVLEWCLDPTTTIVGR